MWTLIWNNYLGLELFGYEENSYYGLGLYWDDAWSSSGMMGIGIRLDLNWDDDWSSTGTKKSGNWE